MYRARAMLMYAYVDKENSFFVGDAAGRAGDFASTDRKLAVNIGLPFYTPEVTPNYISLYRLLRIHLPAALLSRFWANRG